MITKKEKEYVVKLTLGELQFIYNNINQKEMSRKSSLVAQEKIAPALLATDFYKSV